MPKLIGDCDKCGSAIYDIEGQEVCPKCQGPLTKLRTELAWNAYLKAERKCSRIKEQYYAAMQDAEKAYAAYRALRFPADMGEGQ